MIFNYHFPSERFLLLIFSSMYSNHTYNLMHQLVVEQKSLWRIKKYYELDAKKCEKCQEFWQKMSKDKEDHIQELTDILKNHLEQGL